MSVTRIANRQVKLGLVKCLLVAALGFLAVSGIKAIIPRFYEVQLDFFYKITVILILISTFAETIAWRC